MFGRMFQWKSCEKFRLPGIYSIQNLARIQSLYSTLNTRGHFIGGQFHRRGRYIQTKFLNFNLAVTNKCFKRAVQFSIHEHVYAY